MKFEKELSCYCPFCYSNRTGANNTTAVQDIKKLDSLIYLVPDINGNMVKIPFAKYLTVRCFKCGDTAFNGNQYTRGYKSWIKGNPRKVCLTCKKNIINKIGE